MHAERWALVERLYHAARSRPADTRRAFLREACDDPHVRSEVESLLEDPSSAGVFLDRGALAAAVSLAPPHATSPSLGTRFGEYDVLHLVGAGGMGEVYRAWDSALGRPVALKVLQASFTDSAERLARFDREARALAALSHAHIGSIFGVAHSNEVRALVLEFVDGPTLAERIAQGRIPVDEAISIARQIAEALEAAHEHHIVHRDLKPSNIKVTHDGLVKVLDFGLAKILEPAGQHPQAGLTATADASIPGVILGTAAYMSPEQAKGQDVGPATDIWSFGCVFYEMLTGTRLFKGETAADVLGEVLKSEPDWTRLPADTPPAIGRLLQRCLVKDRRRRLRHIGDAWLELDAPAVDDKTLAVGDTAAGWRVAALCSLLAALAGVAGGFWAAPGRATAAETRLDIVTPSTAAPESIAISPDGSKVVYAALSNGRTDLWLRSLDSSSARILTGTEGGLGPFWSPDGRSIGFFADRKLKRLELDGESVQVLADAGDSRGGSWSQRGVILTGGGTAAPLIQVPASGGPVQTATRLDFRSEGDNHRYPQFLPDGRRFIYFWTSAGERQGIYAGELGAFDHRKKIVDADGAGVYVPQGYLLFPRRGVLFAQRFDPETLTVSGESFQVAERIAVSLQRAALFTSTTGAVIYRAGLATSERRFAWFDRTGREATRVGEQIPIRNLNLNPTLSPDGRHVAFNRVTNGNQDIWVLDGQRGDARRLTTDSAVENFAVFSQDGRQVVFHVDRSTSHDLVEKSVDGGPERLLLSGPEVKGPTDWSRDGRYILYRVTEPTTGHDLWALPTFGGRRPFPIVRTTASERDAQLSPDGHWIAYETDASGRSEVVVTPFPPADTSSVVQQVSRAGGAQVRWRGDGRELFYLSLEGVLHAVSVGAMNSGTLEMGQPMPLFSPPLVGAQQGMNKQQYMVSPDGQQFLVNGTVDEFAVAPITLMLNWAPSPGARR